jgi:lincosamide nucleotidyltransferase A/C/D/E
MAVRTAGSHASRGCVVETVANLGQAAICEAHARLAEHRRWALNEKGIVDRAGLGDVHAVLGAPGGSPDELASSVVAVAAILEMSTPAATHVPDVARHVPFAVSDVHRVLDALDRAQITVWVDGGWGVDALVGDESRVHDDLDLVIDAADRRLAEEVLGALGFLPDPAARPGRPARVVLHQDGTRQVDLHPVTFDAAGNGWQDLGHGAWGLYRADGLLARGSIDGRSVACIGAQLQLEHHLGYPPREVDRHDLHRLAGAFDLPLPPGL